MAFNKKTIKDIDVAGKKVLMRADFNVPLHDDGTVADDYRIRAALPTIKYLLDNGAERVGILSHLGRPDGKPDQKFSLKNCSEALEKLLGEPVQFIDDCLVRPDFTNRVAVFENVRFYPEEEADDAGFAEKLAQGFDIFVQDGFGVVHRSQASVSGVAKHLPAVAGFLVEKEVTTIAGALENPAQPFVVVLGGAKIADKIELIENLMKKNVSKFVVGGAMANTFLAARGVEIGKSKYDADDLDAANRIDADLKSSGTELFLPDIDVAVAKEASREVDRSEIALEDIESDDMILDAGTKSLARFAAAIQGAGTVIWNGTLGITELPNFRKSSQEFAKALADSGAKVIIGGGDTAGFIDEVGMLDDFTHVSTGGGASLELMAGKKLSGVEALMNK